MRLSVRVDGCHQAAHAVVVTAYGTSKHWHWIAVTLDDSGQGQLGPQHTQRSGRAPQQLA